MSCAVRFPGEDGGQSLSEMAQRDLDAALHLLADRAQYITGANGAAIALRYRGSEDLLCRASIGPNAPELGALLSTQFGLSGESVRTRKTLRCDDAERDARVNREVCRKLGIASVVVMPVVHDDEVLGVFELFSGKANAFGARDLSALERLTEMVDTAVRLARAAEELPQRLMKADLPMEAPLETLIEVPLHEAATETIEDAPPLEDLQAAAQVVTQIVATPTSSVPAKPPKRALLWSAPETGVAVSAPVADDTSHVPPVLRGLRKCEACGFPVSAGRALCVECEEKKWRGQLKAPQRPPQPVIPIDHEQPSHATLLSATPAPASPVRSSSAVPVVRAFAAAAHSTGTLPGPNLRTASQPHQAGIKTASSLLPDVNESKRVAGNMQTAHPALEGPPPRLTSTPKPEAAASESAFILSAGLDNPQSLFSQSLPSQSWFAANKYILGALVIVAAAVAAILLLR
jgi:hypothetical protein